MLLEIWQNLLFMEKKLMQKEATPLSDHPLKILKIMRRNLQKRRHDPAVKDAIKKISAVIREKQERYFLEQEVIFHKRLMNTMRKTGVKNE
jgi:sulfur relay (sulfurtransferase) DsrC/TusE family protein